mgnify:CR=1 FL=1
MLKAILDIEKKAQEIAGAYDKNVLEEKTNTERILKELEETQSLKAKEELDFALKLHEKYFKTKNKEIINIMKEKSGRMEQIFEEKHEIWINEITQKIIGGDTL